MKRWIILGVGAVLTVPILVFLAIGLGNDPQAIDSPLIGKPAPPFALQDIHGNTVRLEDYRGTPLLINFWATWCQPCIAEHDSFRKASSLLGNRVKFLGVIYQDELSIVRRFQSTRGVWGPTLIDPDSRMAIAYGVYGVPESYLINGEGMIIDKITSPLMTENHVFGWLDQHGLFPR